MRLARTSDAWVLFPGSPEKAKKRPSLFPLFLFSSRDMPPRFYQGAAVGWVSCLGGALTNEKNLGTFFLSALYLLAICGIFPLYCFNGVSPF